MNRTTLRVVLFLTLFLPQAAFASPEVHVELKAVKVSAGGQAKDFASAGGGLVVGGMSGESALEMGDGRCLMTTGGARGGTMPIDPAELSGHVAWLAEFKLLEASLAVIRVQADWRRLVRSEGNWTEERRESEVLTFRPTDRSGHDFVPIDLAEETREDCSGRRLLIGVTARLKEEAALALARFEVDAWWEHAGADGELTTRRGRVSLGQAEMRDLLFESLRWPVPDAHDHELIVDVLPQIQVRADQNGKLEIALDVERSIDLVPAGEPRTGGAGGGGRKSFLVQDGETIRMELPPYRQGSTWFGIEKTATLSRGGSAPTKDLLGSYSVEMDAGAFLQAHADALVLTIRRVD